MWQSNTLTDNHTTTMPITPHKIKTAAHCRCDQTDTSCPVCDQGLAICEVCGRAEIELEEDGGNCPGPKDGAEIYIDKAHPLFPYGVHRKRGEIQPPTPWIDHKPGDLMPCLADQLVEAMTANGHTLNPCPADFYNWGKDSTITKWRKFDPSNMVAVHVKRSDAWDEIEKMGVGPGVIQHIAPAPTAFTNADLEEGTQQQDVKHVATWRDRSTETSTGINSMVGTWFQSACSGMWYQNPKAAGTIQTVKVDGVAYPVLDYKDNPYTAEDIGGAFTQTVLERQGMPENPEFIAAAKKLIAIVLNVYHEHDGVTAPFEQ